MESKKFLAKTSSGFEIELSEDALDNAPLLEQLVALEETDNGLLILKIAQKLLGSEGKEKLYDHLRQPDGRVPMEKLGTEVGELINSVKAAKNSSSSPN